MSIGRKKVLGDYKFTPAVPGKQNTTLFETEQLRQVVSDVFVGDVMVDEVTVNVYWSRKPVEFLAIKRSESLVRDAEALYAEWVAEVQADAAKTAATLKTDRRPF